MLESGVGHSAPQASPFNTVLAEQTLSTLLLLEEGEFQMHMTILGETSKY